MTPGEAKVAFERRYPNKKIADVFSKIDGKYYSSYDTTGGVKGVSWLDNMAKAISIDEETGAVEEFPFSAYIDLLLSRNIKEEEW